MACMAQLVVRWRSPRTRSASSAQATMAPSRPGAVLVRMRRSSRMLPRFAGGMSAQGSVSATRSRRRLADGDAGAREVLLSSLPRDQRAVRWTGESRPASSLAASRPTNSGRGCRREVVGEDVADGPHGECEVAEVLGSGRVSDAGVGVLWPGVPERSADRHSLAPVVRRVGRLLTARRVLLGQRHPAGDVRFEAVRVVAAAPRVVASTFEAGEEVGDGGHRSAQLRGQ